MRKATVKRDTRETQIEISLNIDGSGQANIQGEIGFFNHMLETFARHGLFDVTAHIIGDLHVDQHHTVEDTGIVLGEAFKKALGDKRGIHRAGFFTHPMDEALASVAIDISGRPFLKWQVKLNSKKIGDLQTDLIEDFFQGFTSALGANIHIQLHYGRSDHHKVEAIFKAFAKALRQACSLDARAGDQVPSTKGVL